MATAGARRDEDRPSRRRAGKGNARGTPFATTVEAVPHPVEVGREPRAPGEEYGGYCPAEPVADCSIRIVATDRQRAFGPPRKSSESGSLTGSEVLRARVANLPPEAQVRWRMDNRPGMTGTVDLEQLKPPDPLVRRIRARHPNLCRVVVEVVDAAGRVTCSDEVTLSVPQFVTVLIDLPIYAATLARLGLFPNKPPAALQNDRLAQRVNARVTGILLSTLRELYSGVNVRFVLNQPSARQPPGAANVTEVRFKNAGRQKSFGETREGKDPGNRRGDNNVFIFFENFSRRRAFGGDPLYDRVFGPVAVRDLDGTVRRGKPLTEAEVDPDLPSVDLGQPAVLDRPRQVELAITAIARLTAHVIAHEVGHALGLPVNGEHNSPATGTVMDDGRVQRFYHRTGFFLDCFKVLLEPEQVIAKAVPGFNRDNRRELQRILPVFDI